MTLLNQYASGQEYGRARERDTRGPEHHAEEDDQVPVVLDQGIECFHGRRSIRTSAAFESLSELAPETASFDLLIKGALVYTGEGPALRADVGVADGRISAVEPHLPTLTAGKVLDAAGLMLCPGFIDMHAHTALESFRDPRLEPKVAQGFTSELINPDGLAPAPVSEDRLDARRDYLRPLEGPGPERWTWSTFAEYLDVLADTRPAITLVPSIGHNAVRDFVMGGANRQPDREELRRMREEVRLGLEAGARTLSFGLIYMPGAFSQTNELVELLERARANIDITFDQYPYGAGSTVLSSLLPPWAQEGGPSETLARLADSDQRQTMERDIELGLPGWENVYKACGAECIVVTHAADQGAEVLGKTLAEIGEERGCDPFVTAMDLLRETGLDVTMIDHYATEETVRTIFRHPLHLVGSDGIFGDRPHPRLYGTAARVLGGYALKERVIPVEQAVAWPTARAADRIGLTDRGRIRSGLRADIVLLDPARFVDIATYDDPKRIPEGVSEVF